VGSDELKKLKLKAQIGVTAVLGLFSLGVIIYEPTENWLVKWAIGIIGIIIGYWLK